MDQFQTIVDQIKESGEPATSEQLTALHDTIDALIKQTTPGHLSESTVASEIHDKTFDLIIACFQHRVSRNPITAQTLIEIGLSTLHDMTTISLKTVMSGILKMAVNEFGEDAFVEACASSQDDIRRIMDTARQAHAQHDPYPIPDLPPYGRDPKKSTLH
jgi:hypothetical protein